jgi:hypothetical protein
MAKQKLTGTQVAGLLVDQSDLRPPKAVSAEGCCLEVDHLDPSIHQASVLARPDMLARPAPTREQPVVGSSATLLEPGGQGVARRLGDFERHRAACLLLDDSRPRAKGSSWRDIADTEPYQIAPAQLRVDRTVEERQISHAAGVLQLLTNGPDVLGLQRRLGTDDPPSSTAYELR